MNADRRTWKDEAEVKAFRPELLGILTAAAWRRSNPKFKKYRDGMEDSMEEAEHGYKLLQRGRHSAGQAKILRCKIREGELGQLKSTNDAELLEKLDGLGIDREWKNNEGNEGNPKLLFHFNVANGKPVTLDLTDEESIQ